jgi:two-component system sensor histidine kinase PilS (NtrC family)
MKLASLGRLTAGIAHEIRNPLGAISHAAQLLNESDTLNPADRRMSDIIQQNSVRVNEVIQNILKLSRQDPPKGKPLVLSPWLEQQAADISLIHRLDRSQVTVQVDPPGTTVFADAGQLRQVVEVLCDNAVRHFDRAPAELCIKLLAGITHESGGPFVEIHDNGKGIDRETAKQLFEPFFTTRNEGTGLGLYIARQLSEANHVRLEHQALPGGGSCFRLSFPNPKRPKGSA